MAEFLNGLTESLLRVSTLAAAAFFFSVLVRALVLSVHIVQSASMEPTLRVGDRICVFKRPWRPLAGGDVVVARVSGNTDNSNREVVKRVLWVDFKEDDASRFKWLSRRDGKQCSQPRLFIVGDNVTVSRDSRHYGPIAGKDLVGLAVCVAWPPRRARSLMYRECKSPYQ